MTMIAASGNGSWDTGASKSCPIWPTWPPSPMKTIAATDAKNRFGELIDMAQCEPVHVQRQGRDVAVVLSPDEFRRLSEAASGTGSPAVQKLHAESARRWSKVYEALAK